MIPGKLTTAALIVSLLSVALPAQQLLWENHTNKDNITSLESFAGYVWATSTGGVVRIDPDDNSIRTYMNSDGLRSNLVNFAAYAGDSVVFFGSATGVLSRLDLKTNQFFSQVLQGRDGATISLNAAAAHDDILWIASSVGVIKYDLIRHGGEVKETYRNLGDFPAETPVLDLAVFDSEIIAATEQGLAIADASSEFLLDPNEWLNLAAPAEPACLAILDDVILGTADGAFHLKPDRTFEPAGVSDAAIFDVATNSSSTELYILYNRSGTRGVFALVAGEDLPLTGDASIRNSLNSLAWSNTLFTGTATSGVFEIVGNALQLIAVPGPADNNLVGGGITSDGKLQVVTRFQEISTLQDGVWDQTPVTGLEKLSTLVDAQDNLWIATFGDGALRLLPDGTLQKFDQASSPLIGIQSDPTASVVNNLYQDPAGRIWFSLFQAFPHRPMVVFDQTDSLWTWFGADDDFISGNNQVVAAGNGSAAIGVDDQGIAFLRYGADPFNHADDQLAYFSRSRRLPSAIVSAVAYDRDNRLWVGTPQGLARFDDEIEFFIPVSLPAEVSSEVTALVADSRNNLWVGTSRGLALLPDGGGDTLALTTMNSELVSDQIESLVYDEPTGNLLIFTANGLSILDYTVSGNDGASGVVAYPNPFRIGDGSTGVLQFTIDQRGDIRIFTIAGDLVRTTDVNAGWDGRNASGEYVASGVYIWELHAEDGTRHLGKVFVVRQ